MIWKPERADDPIMFFKRGKKDKSDAPIALPAPADGGDAGGGITTGGSPGAPAGESSFGVPRPLPAGALRRRVEPSALGFSTTRDLEPLHGPVGQERALAAIDFGTGMASSDYNIFVVGSQASGKLEAVKALISQRASADPPPPDWVYVENFDNASSPSAMDLPPGRGRALDKAMQETIDELRAALPAAFEGEDYQGRARAIDAEHRGRHEAALEALKERAAAANIVLLRTPMGFALAPAFEGKVVKPDSFTQLPPSMQKEIEEHIAAFQKELAAILEAAPRIDKERRAALARLNRKVAADVVSLALADVREAFADLDAVSSWLAAVEADLVHNAALFLADAAETDGFTPPSNDTTRDPRFRRYRVNVLQSRTQDARGAPVIEETNPTLPNLVGRIEHRAHLGALVTDFLLIKPGALHRANGGTLLLDARKLLMAPFAWEALKRVLRDGEIRFEQPTAALALPATETLEPEPIPLDVKVVLFGDRQLYQILSQADPDFAELFKVQADFADEVDRTGDNEACIARHIAGIAARHGLKPLDAPAVAVLIEEASRRAGDRDKLSLEVDRLADIIREADYWAAKAGRDTMKADDVRRAVAEHIARADRLRDRTHEAIAREIVLIDTVGERIGQINALSVIDLGDFAFARPTRISARVRFGPGRVTDIEREARLGGPLRSKGVMILWGYLAGAFAEDVPLALSASLVFEQSYGGVDGDSASSAELYALLSALAEVPLAQSIAVTGSVNQWGEVQAIGSVNEKIEGFFDVCRARGLTGSQGVLIPAANVQHLMLREDVVAAVEAGEFAVWPVATIAEGLALLTGQETGARGTDGRFPEGTVFARVEERLRRFADYARAAGPALTGSSAGPGDTGGTS